MRLKGPILYFKGIIYVLEWWFSISMCSNFCQSCWFMTTAMSNLKIYGILIQNLNWILLSLISTKSNNSLQDYKFCTYTRSVKQWWWRLMLFLFFSFSCNFYKSSCGKVCLKVQQSILPPALWSLYDIYFPGGKNN